MKILKTLAIALLLISPPALAHGTDEHESVESVGFSKCEIVDLRIYQNENGDERYEVRVMFGNELATTICYQQDVFSDIHRAMLSNDDVILEYTRYKSPNGIVTVIDGIFSKKKPCSHDEDHPKNTFKKVSLRVHKEPGLMDMIFAAE